MLLKLIIIGLLLAVLISLALALKQLMQPTEDLTHQRKLARALTIRVGLSVALFLLLLLAATLGWIRPHGV